jgi:hypothetical protein
MPHVPQLRVSLRMLVQAPLQLSGELVGQQMPLAQTWPEPQQLEPQTFALGQHPPPAAV